MNRLLQEKGRALRRAGHLFVALLLLLLFPGICSNLKFSYMRERHPIEESLSFSCGGGEEIRCYTPGGERDPFDAEGMSYVFLPSYGDLKALWVETWTPRVEFILGDRRTVVSRERAVVCSFEEDVPYTVCFYDARGREAGRKRVTFLKSGNLPTLYVRTDTGGMELLDADKKYKEGGYARILDPEGSLLLAGSLRSISGRGNHTFAFEKKSYQICLSSPADLLGMGASDTWILLCNVFDPSYVRNKLTYDMALQAGMEGSPKSEYIDVYFNGVYNGMYLLCEKVEIGENRLEFADLEQQNRVLNGGNLDDAKRFSDEEGSRKGTYLLYNPTDITGGYLIEHDYGPKYEEEISGFMTRDRERFVLKNPQHASQEELAYIADRMQDLETAMMAEDGINPETGRHFTENLDLESWADKYLVEEITRNNGGGLSSSYFYKPPDSVSTKIFGGPVWDYDKAYGRVPGYNQNTRDLGFLTLREGRNTRWFGYLYQHEVFVDAVKEEYRKKFADYLPQMAQEKIGEYLQLIEKSAVLDQARFSHVYQEIGGDGDYRGQAEYIQKFLLERKEFLDEVWLEDAPICQIWFGDGEGRELHRLGVRRGECIRELPLDREAGVEFLGWRIKGSDAFLTTEMPITEDLEVYGVWE